MTWTDERVKKLRKMFEAGASCSHIASRLGGVSRNAVIGKLHRLGLMRRRDPSPLVREAKPVVRRVVREPETRTPRPQARTARPLPLPVCEPAAPLMLALEDMKDGQCRYPYGDPGNPNFGFCGHRVHDGRPYCAGHLRIVYVPLSREQGRAA